MEIHGNRRFCLVRVVYSKEETFAWGTDPWRGGQSTWGGSASTQWPEEGVLWLSRGLGCQEGLGIHLIHVEQCSALSC